MEEIRKEFCKKEGYNYIDFETLEQAEKYILFLEKRLKAINHTPCCTEFKCEKCDSDWGDIRATCFNCQHESGDLST
jgi:hypothetical protein